MTSSIQPKRAIIFGCGYLGITLGRRLKANGAHVVGFRRSAEGLAAVEAAGLMPMRGDITAPSDLDRLEPSYDWVINTAAADSGGAAPYEQLYCQGNSNLLRWMQSGRVGKYVYTSSTGVYGQDDGALVDESSATNPPSETAQVLVAAEKLIREQKHVPTVILRLAGIYGRGRGYYLKRYLAGGAFAPLELDRIANMIHVEDAAEAIVAALKHTAPSPVYNVVDDQPSTVREIQDWLVTAVPRPEPGREDAPPSKSRGTNKRVSNRKLKVELELVLTYPSFREGYSAELAGLAPAANLPS